ncbi:ABC transporter ATP-binding protein [Nakamurella lactea]|uniref:ABC transporter ATP-binding protein n=1 Tax=Nakamurella lactea TaxID=459515 RepID=UPI000414DCFD|nr:ABC transporter ATP-binding protein [Nakamurella lactea]
MRGHSHSAGDVGGERGGRGGRPDASSAKKKPEDIAQLAEHPVSLRRIGALFRPYRARLAVVVALIVATSLVGLASPFITKHLIDDAIPNKDVSLLLLLVGGMLGITVLSSVFGVLQTWLSTVMGQKVMHGLRTSVFSHLQRMPLSFFTRTRGGELQSRLTNDINGMQSVVTNSATSIASNLTTVVGTAVAMAALSWRLSLLSLIVLPPAIYLTRRVARMRRAVTTKAQRALADMQTQIEESLSISGVQLSKTLGSGPQLSQRFTKTSVELTDLEVSSQLAGRWRMATMSIIFAAIPALIYLAAGLPATSGGMTIGTLVAFTALQSALFRPLMGVLNVGVQINSSLALFSRIFEYLDMPVEIDDPADAVDLPVETASGTVRFENVTFRYPGSDRDALTSVDLELPAGRTVAVVGATGSGKSTLAGLVSRLHDPSSGTVSIDGVDLRDMLLKNVADLVGVVSQETYLLHTSIAENLRYAKTNAADDEIIAAAKAAQVHEMILDLPDGYDTVVGARGYRFSGGEKQRIALARTILRDPKVLVLDEATSALDNNTERAVQAALDAASHGRTTLTIAHRLSTVRHADLIVVMDHGAIVERGDHDELMAIGGRYAALVNAQADTDLDDEFAAADAIPAAEFAAAL